MSRGEKRALIPNKKAISSPLLDISIEGARGVLFNIVGGPDLSMTEIDEAATIISKTVDPDADIIFGAVIDEKMLDQIKITIIATKFDERRLKLFRFKRDEPPEGIEKKDAASSSQPANPPKPTLDEDLLTDEDLLETESEFDIPAFLRKK